jgi:hypothetical protein
VELMNRRQIGVVAGRINLRQPQKNCCLPLAKNRFGINIGTSSSYGHFLRCREGRPQSTFRVIKKLAPRFFSFSSGLFAPRGSLGLQRAGLDSVQH